MCLHHGQGFFLVFGEEFAIYLLRQKLHLHGFYIVVLLGSFGKELQCIFSDKFTMKATKTNLKLRKCVETNPRP